MLNLVEVSFVDSAGLGLSLLAKPNLSDPNCKLSIVIGQGYAKNVLELANMGKHLQIMALENASTGSSPIHR